MKIPKNLTEDEVLSVIAKVSRRFSRKFSFGYYDAEDIEQECFILCMDALEKYDEERPLENFLAVHLSNRLKTLKRNKFFRLPEPCSICTEDEICSTCAKRNARNEVKKLLMQPIDIDCVNTEEESNAVTEVDYAMEIELSDIQSLIDQYLPQELRSDYLRMVDEIPIPKKRRERVENEIRGILMEHGYVI